MLLTSHLVSWMLQFDVADVALFLLEDLIIVFVQVIILRIQRVARSEFLNLRDLRKFRQQWHR